MLLSLKYEILTIYPPYYSPLACNDSISSVMNYNTDLKSDKIFSYFEN